MRKKMQLEDYNKDQVIMTLNSGTKHDDSSQLTRRRLLNL